MFSHADHVYEFMLLALGKASISLPSSVFLQTSKSELGVEQVHFQTVWGRDISASVDIYSGTCGEHTLTSRNNSNADGGEGEGRKSTEGGVCELRASRESVHHHAHCGLLLSLLQRIGVLVLETMSAFSHLGRLWSGWEFRGKH